MFDQTAIILGFAALLGVPCLAIAFSSVVAQWIAFRQRKLEFMAASKQDEIESRGQTMKALRERVAVLEELATDPGVRIADEISRLGPR